MMAIVKTKAKAKTTTKKVAEPVDFLEKVSYEVENLTKTKALRMVNTLSDNIEHNQFKLGGVLCVIKSNKDWYAEQYESFDDMLKGEFENIGTRKASYLIDIYEALIASGVAWDSVKDIGWSKLRMIAKSLTKENVEDWAKTAKSMTKAELEHYIKNQGSEGLDKPPEHGEVTKLASLSFKLHEDQKITIREALDKAKEEAETDVDTVALEAICMNYIAGGSEAPQPLPKEAFVGEDSDPVFEEDVTIGEMMRSIGWEATLEEFEKVYPNVYVQASLEADEDISQEA